MQDLPPPPRLPRTAALFLDLDGTLAPIEQTPEAVRPQPRRTAVLREVTAGLQGRVAVVSGRSLDEIDRILEGAAASAAGVHGLDLRLPGGERLSAEPHPGLEAAREALGAFAMRSPGLQVEDKRLGLTLHYRLAPEAETEAKSLGAELASRTGLALQLGDKVVELRTPGRDKGEALRLFMDRAPFAGATPIFIGDDLTDEHGFKAASALGGFGVLVGALRPTAAAARLDSVEAVLDWLQSALEEATP